MTQEQEQKLDARGVEIEVGQTVIYGAPVGRSIALVEGVIDGFTPTGRAWVKVTRRAMGYGDAPRVHVGPDRLVVVTELPPSTLPTNAERHIASLEINTAYWSKRIAEIEQGSPERWEGELAGAEGIVARNQRDLAKARQ